MTTPAPAPDSKPWYKSMTIWGTIITGVVSVFAGVGVLPAGIDKEVGTALGLLGSVLALYGRVRATVPIKF